MSTLRSKHGCWTCRLRKKKCDESAPECASCVGLSITCYGYGPKPHWMDSGEAEKRIANSIKEIVKYTSRYKTSTHVPVTRKAAPKLAPKSIATTTTTSTAGSGASRLPETTPPSNHDLSHNRVVPQDSAEHLSIGTIPAEESILLMQFLDKVFPLQYPVYQPDIFEGGRGWLLALLLRTKPLYYAALALSSYHRRMLIFQRISQRCEAAARVQQGKHLDACLIEAQQAMRSVDRFIQSGESSDGMGLVTSIVQLVFFELFAGQDGVWKTHLNAAIDVYRQHCKDELAHLGLSRVSRLILRDEQSLKDDGAVVTQEVTTFRFMEGSIIWLDVISSITSGMAPRLLDCHPGVLAPDSHTKLENIMGCRNWAMQLIGRISALHGQMRGDPFDHEEFCQTVTETGIEIRYGLTDETSPSCSIPALSSFGIQDYLADPDTLITRIFAWMAAVYLHLVTHGFQRLEKLDAPISSAVTLLRTQIPSSLIPALVAPLFVIGCVAREGEEQDFFESIYASMQFRDPFYKHRVQISAAVEDVWGKRRDKDELSWEDVIGMDKVQELLLV